MQNTNIHTLATLAIALILASGPAIAVPIRYTLTGTATGSLGDAPFSSAPFTAVLETDTLNVFTWTDGISQYAFAGPFTDPPGSATIQIQGLPMATFLVPAEIFLGRGYAGDTDPFLSFGRPNTRTTLPGFAAMSVVGMGDTDLASDFGTYRSDGRAYCSSGPAISTDLGMLSSNSCGSTLSSITAEFVTPVIPVPAAAWLLAGALGVLGFVRRSEALVVEA